MIKLTFVQDFQLVFVLAFQIFAILNPMAVTPVLISMTEKLEPKHRRFIVVRSTTIVLVLAIAILFLGRAFLDLLSVPISSFRLAGGLLFLISALKTFLTEDRSKTMARTMERDHEQVSSDQLTELAAVPFALPLLLGPGTITLILTISTQYSMTPIFFAIIIAVVLSGLFLLSSDMLIKVLRPIGIRVLARLMALVVASVGVEFIHLSLIDWGIASK